MGIQRDTHGPLRKSNFIQLQPDDFAKWGSSSVHDFGTRRPIGFKYLLETAICVSKRLACEFLTESCVSTRIVNTPPHKRHCTT